jgi:putative ABC transport system ATP-binding protein
MTNKDTPHSSVEPLLCIQNLSKAYGSQNILNKLSMQVCAGEIVAITGPSGCGKTTLLNLIAGLDDPDEGRIVVANQSLDTMNEQQRTLLRRRSIGFIFQFFNLIPTLTVAENCCLPLELNKMIDQKTRVLDQLQQVGLKDKLDQFPEQLSGGEQQRVAIIRALAHQPKIVLADEPTGNLDQHTAEIMADFIREQVKQRHCALLMVTHSQSLAEKADRILHMQNQHLS